MFWMPLLVRSRKVKWVFVSGRRNALPDDSGSREFLLRLENLLRRNSAGSSQEPLVRPLNSTVSPYPALGAWPLAAPALRYVGF